MKSRWEKDGTTHYLWHGNEIVGYVYEEYGDGKELCASIHPEYMITDPMTFPDVMAAKRCVVDSLFKKHYDIIHGLETLWREELKP
ncbi:MAG: hypothetical protein COA69_09545 [Robiginitomaculum sp.]|nr:MAG: hypothetical protein COA69_09545 [Robiginitomaculum sp.]